VLPGFWSPEQVKSAREAIAAVVDEMDLDESRTVFTTKEQSRVADDYFLGSGDKVRFFWEEGAFNEAGDFTQEKLQCINKIGHSLHDDGELKLFIASTLYRAV
jgi:phytanoyl-CoA hydroxylase